MTTTTTTHTYELRDAIGPVWIGTGERPSMERVRTFLATLGVDELTLYMDGKPIAIFTQDELMVETTVPEGAAVLDSCVDCRGIADLTTVDDEGEELHLCNRCATARGFVPCDACGKLFPVNELVAVQTCRATHDSPAEYAEVCQPCGNPRPERDYDRDRDERDGF